jgi:hypothetical protein
MLRTTKRRTIIASALGVLGAASPMFAAEPWFRISWGHSDARRERVVIREPRRERWPEVRHEAPRVEEIPCDLRLSAYQTKDTVVVVARGTNRAAGYATALSSCGVRGRAPELVLHNLAPQSCGAQVQTAFEVTGSFTSCERVACLKVIVAGKTYDVGVTQVCPLS